MWVNKNTLKRSFCRLFLFLYSSLALYVSCPQYSASPWGRYRVDQGHIRSFRFRMEPIRDFGLCSDASSQQQQHSLNSMGHDVCRIGIFHNSREKYFQKIFHEKGFVPVLVLILGIFILNLWILGQPILHKHWHPVILMFYLSTDWSIRQRLLLQPLEPV